MAAKNFKKKPSTPVELHRSWLELVDIEGPFLAIPPLRRVWGNGMPNFHKTYPDRYQALQIARKEFEQSWEQLDQQPDDPKRQNDYRVDRDIWVEYVLREIVGWGKHLEWKAAGLPNAHSPDHSVTVTATGRVSNSNGDSALLLVVDATDSLHAASSDGWAATPIDRMEELLRQHHIPVGIVTDGRWWAIVSAQEGVMTASGVFDALTWSEEPRSRDAFFALISLQYLIGGKQEERLAQLFADSVAAAEEITEALGAQVRRSVELLIQAFSESSRKAREIGEPDSLPTDDRQIYEAAVTIMMRTVFLLFAEERQLLPNNILFTQAYGISRELDFLDERVREEGGEDALDASSLTWHRLLGTSQALYAGATFEGFRMPAYAGSLFDPDRFPFLTATNEHGALTTIVSDRVMLHVLKSVQVAEVKGEARRISFRDIDVEQIGYIYEGLLGYTVKRVERLTLGLKGRQRGAEPEIPLEELERLHGESSDTKKFGAALTDWVKADQPSAKPLTAAQINKSLNEEIDPRRITALSRILGNDEELRDQITSWLGLIRDDLRSLPFIALPGDLIVVETPSRKHAGAHYTPKSLAEEVVLHALQPLCYSPGPYQTNDESEWKLRPADEILDLKVADIACGSGAFLVAAARYLADRVVEAWSQDSEDEIPSSERRLLAIRKVVARCLYGADINEMAAEMCKLSLWLVSLDPNKPFSFVDDKIFVGNSLLGITDLDQLRALHIDPKQKKVDEQLAFNTYDIDTTIQKAIDLRRSLASEVDELDPERSSKSKRRKYEEYRQVTADLRQVADGVVAAGLELGGKPGSQLNEAYENLRHAVNQSYPSDGMIQDEDWLDAVIDRGLRPTVDTDYERWRPIHWAIEAPDVIVERGGFDAVIGNPPFLGGQKLTGAMGTEVRAWLINVLANEVSGSADLVAYFFLRVSQLMNRRSATLGLIATNTLAQGATREVGLDQMEATGFEIVRAIQSREWPAASANLQFAAVWGTYGAVSAGVNRESDDTKAKRISTLLEPAGRVTGKPVRLVENLGIAFQGCIVLGKGFVIEPELAQQWIDHDPSNAEVLFPYLNGEDLNSRPDSSPSRWVVDFNERTETESRQYTNPYTQLVLHVRPERQRVKEDGAYVLRRPLPQKWWQYGEKRPALRQAIRQLDEVLVIALVSKTVMPMRVATGQVFSHALGVFATDSFADQAVLSSTPHQLWAITYGSTLETRVRYTPSDVFETFPRPMETDVLHEIGTTLDEERREIMLRRDLGLTKLYNLVNDPQLLNAADVDVSRLREIHVQLDHAVMDAYGWSDIELNHGFHTYRQMERWTICPEARVEILDRLLEENHRRAAAEKENGKKKSKAKSKSAADDQELTLEL